MEDLILNVTEKWFNLIKSGKKTREYREIKPYWTKRLGGKRFKNVIIVRGYPKNRDETNSITFPYKGYILTMLNKEELSYNEVLGELNVIEPDLVYAIPLGEN